jgi:hypothetical protein
MQAIEKNIEFDEKGNSLIHLGINFSMKKAKVVLLFEDDDISEKEWLQFAMKGGAFDFLNDPAEDIYTMEDGIPYEKKQNEI